MASITGLYACPACGKGIQFESQAINHKVCTCGSVITRVGNDVAAKNISIISQADDIIQPGTEGVWNQQNFSITGRFRIWFEGTAYNYWTMLMADGSLKLLAEGYGMFAVYERLDYCNYLVSPELKRFTSTHPLLLLNHGEVFLSRQNNGQRFDVEGAFYMPFSNSKITTFEAENDAISLEIFEFGNDIIEAYKSISVGIDDLGLKYTRSALNTGKAFICGECKKENIVKVYPYVQSWVCNNCGQRYSLKLSTLVENEGNNPFKETHFHISINTSLTLHGITYEVIGLAHKQDFYEQNDSWNEYTLYSHKYGFAFLNETDGHWLLVKESNNNPGVSCARSSYFIFDRKKFEVFLEYRFRIVYAEGCFPGNVFDEQHDTSATDFISPPYTWSVERHPKKGITWFYGTYLEPYEIKSQIDGRLPHRVGVAPGQPSFGGGMVNIIRGTLVILLILIGVFILTGYSNTEHQVFDLEIPMSDSLANTSVVSPLFELKKWKSNLEFEISAPVDNSWFELSATLVNAKTGDEYSLEQGVEYYHGYSEGESWSEGSTTETAYLSSIPAGKYFLRLNGLRDAGVVYPFNIRSFRVKVLNDTTMSRNFWLTLLILLVVPAGMLWLQDYREKSRWSASPHSKYNYN